MKRVFLYARVSTEEQAIHGLSIEAQTLALEEWAKANGHKVVGLYVDAGISARKPANKRPDLQRLLADVRAGKGDLVVFTKLDRWFRNIAEYYKVQEVLEKYNVGWKTIQEDYDTSTSPGRLKINIMLSVAQDEADRTSERIKAINEMKRQKKEPLTGQMPFGYILENGKIIKDPKTEKAVETFFHTLLATGSISTAQRDVFEQFNVMINYQRAYKMMKSTAYYGRYFGADGMTPPYLTQEEYKRVLGLKRKIVRKSPQNHIFLFSGLVFCSECGRRMGTRRSTIVNYYYYTCPAHYTAVRTCENRVCKNEKEIEQYILDHIEEKIQQEKVELGKWNEARAAKNYKQEISAVRRKLDRLKDLYVNDLITMEDFRADHAVLTARLNELTELDQPIAMSNLDALNAVLESGWRDAYMELSREHKREAWRTIIKKIKVFPDRHIEFDMIV